MLNDRKHISDLTFRLLHFIDSTGCQESDKGCTCIQLVNRQTDRESFAFADSPGTCRLLKNMQEQGDI